MLNAVNSYVPLWVFPSSENPGLSTTPFPRPSRDTGLTAFAQLAALRLHAKRVLISLIDRSRQYIIAEATRTLSFQSDELCAQDDPIWFGACAVTRGAIPMCASAITSFARDDASRIAIDLVEDDRFKSSSFVASHPSVRFYMCVPIRSPSGFVIGNFCALDDRARGSITENEWQFMEDMAATVMDYLLTQKALREERRGEKMVEALGLFMNGKASLVDRSPKRNLSIGTDGEACFGSGNTASSKNGYALPGRSGIIVGDRMGDAKGDPLLPPLSNVTPRPDELHISDDCEGLDIIFKPDADKEQTQNTRNKHIRPTDLPRKFRDPHLHDSLPSSDLKNVFGRASNLIREGLGVEGVVFFDVRMNASRGAPSFQEGDASSSDSGISSFPTQASSRDDDCLPISKGAEWEERFKTCHVLGYSTTTSASIGVSDSLRRHISLPESFAKKLLKRYHQGKVFHVDEDGSVSVSEDNECDEEHASEPSDAPPTRRPQRIGAGASRRPFEVQTILDALPGARNIAFYPALDLQSGRWFAGCFVWTTDPLRVFRNTKELTYLAAFTNSVMAEVSRIDIQLADRAKADFISSISHELRSPLHGVLASVEILRDTQMDPSQKSLVKTIHHCGKTLLDTINHVLDFTKINKLMRSKRTGKSSLLEVPSKISLLEVPDLMGDADISNLVQEVVEGMVAGRNYMGDSLSQSFAVAAEPSEQVVVILDIAWAENWLYSVPLGAWRRVVMNLVSNSLKYTQRGYVQVSLKPGPAPIPRSGTPTPTAAVKLTVKDSGCGISKGFLERHLYTPFLQEDPLSEGTGLGLSIVRKIVGALGGSIRISSEQGKGTKAEVFLPVSQPTLSPPRPAYFDLRERLAGMAIGISDSRAKIERPGVYEHTAAVDNLGSILARLCTDWFGLRVTSAAEGEYEEPDILLIIAGDRTKRCADADPVPDKALSWRTTRQRPPIVLCTDMVGKSARGGTTTDVVSLYQP